MRIEAPLEQKPTTEAAVGAAGEFNICGYAIYLKNDFMFSKNVKCSKCSLSDISDWHYAYKKMIIWLSLRVY